MQRKPEDFSAPLLMQTLDQQQSASLQSDLNHHHQEKDDSAAPLPDNPSAVNKIKKASFNEDFQTPSNAVLPYHPPLSQQSRNDAVNGERHKRSESASSCVTARPRVLSDLTDSTESAMNNYINDNDQACSKGRTEKDPDESELPSSHQPNPSPYHPPSLLSSAAVDVALAQAAIRHNDLVIDERLTLEDLTPSIDDEVEAALIDALEKKEKVRQVHEAAKKTHRKLCSAGIPLESVSEDAAAKVFLTHFEETAREETMALEDNKWKHAKDLLGHKNVAPGSRRSIASSEHVGSRRSLHATSASTPTKATALPPEETTKGHKKNKSSVFADLATQLREEHRGGSGAQGHGGWDSALKRLELNKAKAATTAAGASGAHAATVAQDGLRENWCDTSTMGGDGVRATSSRSRANDEPSHHGGTGGSATTAGTPPRPTPPEGSVDMMYKHASIIFNRRTSSNRHPRPEEGIIDLESGSCVSLPPHDNDEKKKQTARSNWGRLKYTIQATGAMSSGGTGQSDKPRQPSNDDGDDEGGGDGSRLVDEDEETSSDRSYRRKMKNGNILTKTFWWVLYRFRMVFELRKHLFQVILYTRTVVMWLGIPLLGVAAIMFYLIGDPPGPMTNNTGASWSWWLIFIFRQVMTMSLGKGVQYFFVDCLCLRSQVALNMFGPAITLGMVQSKGWPFILTSWALWDFAILQGNFPYTNHWLFWQDMIKMYNANNPSGDVLASDFYKSLLITAIVVGVLTSIKRTVVSFYLGSKTCEHYGPQLEKLMKDMIILSSVANLAKEIERSQQTRSPRSFYPNKDGFVPTALYMWQSKLLHRRETFNTATEDDVESENSDDDSDNNTVSSSAKGDGAKEIPRDHGKTDATGASHLSSPQLIDKLRMSEKNKLMHLLEFWEEPTNLEDVRHSNVTIHDILQFRQALAHMGDMHPFSVAFGLANTRENCIDSAQQVYQCLLKHTPQDSVLPFETISILALDNNGDLKIERARPLIRLFRPDRNGKLTVLDFVRSCDGVYKKLRMLRASVANASAIDNAYEKIINAAFFFVVAIIVLLILKIDPWATLLALSSLTVSFAFAFGSAVSKFTEGVLLVTVRRPYDIGDRVHISNPNEDTNADGTSTWFVENITLFTTILRFATTNEVCSIANGSLANSRIVNGARSPKALVYVHLKFGIEVPYEKVKFFRSTVDSFVKSRPRTWTALCAFRATRVQADLGYIEYVLVLQHRESWQNVGAILDSKAELSSFCLEVSKKLGMRYIAPPLPVQLGLEEGAMSKFPADFLGGSNHERSTHNTNSMTSASGLEEVKAMFKVEDKRKKSKRVKAT